MPLVIARCVLLTIALWFGIVMLIGIFRGQTVHWMNIVVPCAACVALAATYGLLGEIA